MLVHTHTSRNAQSFFSHKSGGGMRLSCVLVLAVVLMTTSLAYGADVTCPLGGLVRDATGAGLSGAVVIVQNWDLPPPMKHPRVISHPVIRTDSEGRFCVNLPPGLYDMSVSYIAMEPVATKVEIKSAAPTKLDCRLELSRLTPTAGPLKVISNATQSSGPPPPSSSSGACVDRSR